MSVYYKLRANDGVVSENYKNGGCWGFLKTNLHKVAEGYLARRGAVDVSYEEYVASRRRMYGRGTAVDSKTEYTEAMIGRQDKHYQLPIPSMATGIKDVISCRHTIGYAGGGLLRYKALKTVMDAYPKLFTGVTHIGRVKGEITVDFNDHYAVIYNVLRLIKKFKTSYLSAGASRAMINNPALSLFILDMYAPGQRMIGDSNVFTVHDTGIKAIESMVDRREWILTDRQRSSKGNNASLRGGCSKSRCLSYVELVDSGTAHHESYDLRTSSTIHYSLEGFLDTIPKSLRGAA